MKKRLSLVLAVILLLTLAIPAGAVEDTPTFAFLLSVDGSDQKEVRTGDIITVTFQLNRTDEAQSYTMYAMQNEIRYDGDFFELVEGSAMLSNGITSANVGLRDSYRELYMNFVSMSGGESWEAQRLVGSFQLRVKAQTGVSQITNQDYLVSTADGTGSYAAQCQDVTVVVSSDCTVRFDTNGGTPIDSVTARYNETIARPEDPVREGYHVAGWYSDIDLQQEWNFETDTVKGNMTLYVRWEEGDPVAKAGGGNWLLFVLLGLLLLVLAGLVALVLLGEKTIRFETGCDIAMEPQKYKRGDKVTCPQEPVRYGRTFVGWYTDETYSKKWDFETDTVKGSMTLYARWL